MSFSDMLKNAKKEAEIQATSMKSPAIMTLSLEDAVDNIPAYSGEEYDIVQDEEIINPEDGEIVDENEWVLNLEYRTTESFEVGKRYVDENYSTVDEKKNVHLDPSQINLTQESNSQYVTFIMPRYFDGIDLMDMVISIYFINADGGEGFSDVINMYYNATQIKFGWVLSEAATALKGKLQFEIHATGVDPLGRNYLLKTRPNSQMEVLESLHGNGKIIYDETWATTFLNQINSYVMKAEKAALKTEQNLADVKEIVEQAEENLTGYSKGEVDELLTKKAEVSTVEVLDTLVGNLSDSIIAINNEETGVLAKAKQYSDDQDLIIKNDVSNFKNYVGTIPPWSSAATVIRYIQEELGNYYNKEKVDELFETFDISSQLTGIEERVGELETEFDNFDGLANLKVEFNAETKTLSFYNGDVKIKDIILNISSEEDIANALKPIEEDLENIHSTIDDLPETLASDYYTKTATDDLLALKADKESITSIETDIETNTGNISSLTEKVKEINSVVDGIDKTPKTRYRATYGDVELDDGSTAEYMFTLWKEEEGVETVQDRFQILGGGGGSGSSVNMKIAYVEGYPQSSVFTVNDDVIIKYNFEGIDSAGDYIGGTASWKVGSKVVLTEEISSGVNEVDLTNYVGIGDTKVLLTITHSSGAIATKSWNVKVVDVRIRETFNNQKTYPANSTVEFTYIPEGSVDKTVYFILDGEEIGTKISKGTDAGISDSYILPAQSHGSHLLEVYMTAMINGKPYPSNRIYSDIIWYDEASDVPVIGCSTPKLTVTQYDAIDIIFTVYDPTTETPTVIIEDNGQVIETLNGLTNKTNTYRYSATEIGSHEIVLICRETRKSITMNVEELDINISPVTASLAFDFNPVGYSNSSENRLWSYDSVVENSKIEMTVSDNFDWINGGYQTDKDGSYFCIKAGTTATINYKMFCATKNVGNQGGHYKLVFKTVNVQDASKPFFKCFKDNVGVIMQPHETNFYAGSGNSLYLAYSENDTIEFELNMGEEIPNSTDKMVMGYEDGVATKPLVYTSGASFIQGIQDADAEYITLGSTSCDLYIYRFKAYRKALTSKEVLNNFITDARSASEMLNRYNRNQIYNEEVSNLNAPSGYSEAYIEHFAKQCPDLRVILLSCPNFTTSKDVKVQNCTVRQIYTNGREVEDNWTVYNMIHSGQGTSSNLYGASGRNLDLIMNKKNDAGEYPWIEFLDGTTLSGKELKLNLTETSVPINYLNIKLNIASSENANNAELARRYNQFNPYKRPLVREEGYPYIVKDTMEFYNCVVFIQETDTAQDTNGNYISHVEFNDCNWHYYGLGNIGDSKKTDKTRMNDPNDVNEFVVEVMDNNLPNSKFQSGVYDDKGYSITGEAVANEWKTYKDDTYEMDKKYTVVTNTEKVKYLIDENLPILYELIDGEYVLTSDETINSDKTYYEKNYPNAAYAGLYKDKYYFDIEKSETELESGWGISFECRYEHDDSDHEEHRRLWNEFYEFVIFSSDKEFYEKLSDYCVLNSVMFYYLFTLRYTMIDNRAKNSFWHYGKCEDGKYRWDLTMDYDNDTALGIDNFGKQVYRYGYEDFDYVDSNIDAGDDYTDENGKAWVFNAATSTFYNRLRLLFAPELRSLYNELDGKGAWNAESLITQWDSSQSQFPEEVWRQDIIRKYIRPYTVSYINGEPDTTFLTDKMNGRKKYHRREFERNQSVYMASKYRTTDVRNNIIRLRANMPTGNLAVPVDLSLRITPYMHMYVSVDYANGVITRQYRGKPGEEILVDYPLDSGDIIAIENAPYIQSIGDISAIYTGEATLTTGTRLKDVLLGNSTPGYSNTYLPNITMVKDGLVETINIENIQSLDDELDVSTLRNLKTVLAKGSRITGLILAKNCATETLSLPPLSSLLSMKNLVYLKDVDFESLNNLDGLIIENCNLSTIENFVIGNIRYESPNELTFLDNAPNLKRVRLTGINWNLPDISVLERLYSTSIGGYDANGNPTTRAYISGTVYVPSINEYDKKKYEELWNDLVIEGEVVPQFMVTFVNYNGQILDEQPIIKGKYPVDPITRSENPIAIPTRESDVDKVYTYSGWDYGEGNTGFIPVLEPLTYMATYTSEVRRYTVKFVQPNEFRLSNPIIKEIKNAPYGSYVYYDGEIPTYTALEETAFTYYLFKGWDKSGRVDGDKTITAVYDNCEYTSGYFRNLEIGDMRPVDIYALTRLIRQGQINLSMNSDGSDYTGIDGTRINQYDSFGFSMGHDVDYGDVESKIIIGKGAENSSYNTSKVFNGTIGEYYDTGISIFDVDRSFVLAVDYEFASGNSNGATLMQCYDVDTDGFKLYYNGTTPSVMWFNNSSACASGTNREMLVIRHKAGEYGADIYASNLTGYSVEHIDFSDVGSRIPNTNSTLVFGCNKEVSEDGTSYKNYAKGTIHWAKIWYDDLGEDTCEKLASYIHEDVSTHVSGFRRHYISGTKSTPVFSFLGSKALYSERAMNLSSGNNGGWASSYLRTWLNNRFYNGIPLEIKQLIKSVTISSTVGSASKELSESNCYIYIPAYADLSDTTNVTNGNILKSEISPPGSLISYMTFDSDRIRYNYDGSEAIKYYTRSPGLGFTSYFYYVDTTGKLKETGFTTNTPMGVVIAFSI